MSCLKSGTTLAVPTTRFEALALVELTNGNARWVGVSRIDTNNMWTTVYGNEATYLPWDPGNSESNGTGECVIEHFDGEYDDTNCQIQYPYHCECRR